MISAAQSIVCLCAIQPDACAVRKPHHQVTLTLLDAWDACSETLEIFPGDIFGLRVSRSEICEASVLAFTVQRSINQVHDARDGLAAAAMDDKTGPALFARMERLELRACRVADSNLGSRALDWCQVQHSRDLRL